MLFIRGIEISSAEIRLDWLHKWTMWEVVNSEIAVLIFTVQGGES